MRNCIVCKNPVDFEVVREEFESLLEQVDTYGVESLTEAKQFVYEGAICSYDCYENLP